MFEPRVLPFGMRLSPWPWTKVLGPVVAALRARGHRVIAFVDDFASTGRRGHPSMAADATAGRAEIIQLFVTLGVHVHPAKGVTQGTQRLPLFGFLVDIWRRLLLQPAARLTALVTGARLLLTAACRHGRWVRHRAFQQLNRHGFSSDACTTHRAAWTGDGGGGVGGGGGDGLTSHTARSPTSSGLRGWMWSSAWVAPSGHPRLER